MPENINPICSAARQLMDAYADGTLGASESDALAAHLKSCPVCTEEYRALLKIKTLIKSSEYDVPDDLHKKIMEAVKAERQMAVKRAKLRKITRYSAIAAGAVLVLTLGVSGIYRSMVARTSDEAAVADDMPPLTYATSADETNTEAETSLEKAGSYMTPNASNQITADDAYVDEILPDSEENTEAPLMAAMPGAAAVYDAPSSAEAMTEAVTEAVMEAVTEADETGSIDAETTSAAEDKEENANAADTIGELSTVEQPVEQFVEQPASSEMASMFTITSEEDDTERLPAYTSTTAMLSFMGDAPFTDIVNDIDSARLLVGIEEFNKWYSTVWKAYSASERASVPLLYAVIQAFDVPREVIEEKFSLGSILSKYDSDSIFDMLILDDDIIDALYSDTDTMRKSLVDSKSLYWDGTIYTYYWLLNNSTATVAPPVEVVLDFAATKITVWDKKAAQDLIDAWTLE